MKLKIVINVLFILLIFRAAILSEGVVEKNSKHKSREFSRIHTAGQKNGDLKENYVLKKTSDKLHLAGSISRPEYIGDGCRNNYLRKGKSRRCGCWCPIPGAEEAAAPKKKPEEPCCCPCCCPCCPRPCCHHHHHHCCCPCCHCCHCCHCCQCCHCCPCCCHCCHCKRSQGAFSPFLVKRTLYQYKDFSAANLYVQSVDNGLGLTKLHNGPLKRR
ncbi:unnamed protein product [Porites lobata]|uniref:Uncharacterized protein n=1 Tax=Porites lobata TaxID=104759 RepID=A0ABN8MSL9_9CNID|nr:unnamed protein product [Porites lobata]